MNNAPEKMQEFFNNRVDIYDTQQIKNIDGGEKCYQEIACHIPLHTNRLLDLGSGTGLELESIFRKFPEVNVTCIDLADKMLEKLSEKYSAHSVHLVNDNYLTADLGKHEFDAVVSIMSFHHFTHTQKLKLYSSIFECLKPNGVFIECDYMIASNDSQLEKQYLMERQELLLNHHLPESLYHYDIPFTVDHEQSLFQQAGFQLVRKVWGIGNNIMLCGQK